MLNVKVSPVKNPQSGWFYGHSYMVQISRGEAKKLGRTLPEVGYEVIVKSVQDWLYSTSKHYLAIHNISGQLMLASCTTKIQDWPEIFGVSVFLK